MKRTTKLALAVGTALALGIAFAEVSAHGMGYGPNDGGMGYGMHGNGNGNAMGQMGMFGGSPGTAEDRLAGLKSDLGITAGQDKAWQAFAKIVQQQDETMRAWFTAMHQTMSAGTPPDRLAQHDAMFKQQQAVTQTTDAARKDLYATLTPEQKVIADRRLDGVGFGPMAGAGGGMHGQFR